MAPWVIGFVAGLGLTFAGEAMIYMASPVGVALPDDVVFGCFWVSVGAMGVVKEAFGVFESVH